MKRQISSDNECPQFLWSPGEQMDLTDAVRNRYGGELRPVEAHVKPDGGLNDRPSFCFVLEHTQSGGRFTAQITLDKLMPSIKAALDADIVRSKEILKETASHDSHKQPNL